MTERVIDVVPGLIRGHKRDGRCSYDAGAKAELVRRCLQPGVSVAAMALAHGVNANLVRKWITLSQRERSQEDNGRATLLPVVTTVSPASTLAAAPTGSDGAIELVLPVGTIRVRGAVEAATLSTVIDCLLRRA
jgi:transposase-like protein